MPWCSKYLWPSQVVIEHYSLLHSKRCSTAVKAVIICAALLHKYLTCLLSACEPRPLTEVLCHSTSNMVTHSQCTFCFVEQLVTALVLYVSNTNSGRYAENSAVNQLTRQNQGNNGGMLASFPGLPCFLFFGLHSV